MEVIVCIGSSCHLKGARDVIKILERNIKLYSLDKDIDFKGSFCMGKCSEKGVCVSVNGKKFSVLPLETEGFFKKEILGGMAI